MTIADVLRLPMRKAITASNATVIPWQPLEYIDGKEVSQTGVIGEAGMPIFVGALANFRTRAKQPSPELAHAVADNDILRGKWLFGGLCCDHFGHFITNSMGRLWATEMIDDLDGIVFIADRTQTEHAKIYNAFQPVLGLPKAHKLCLRPTRVEELVVVPDLFSEGRRCVPALAFDQWARSKIPKVATPDRDVYITRSQFDPTRGKILCEDILEDNFRTAGYQIFAPETASVEEQIETYAHARNIVGSEGSGLHLAALAAGNRAHITCIQRRPALQFMLNNQLTTTLQARFHTLNHLNRLSHPAKLSRPWVRVLSASPESTRMRSPFCAPVRPAHWVRSS